MNVYGYVIMVNSDVIWIYSMVTYMHCLWRRLCTVYGDVCALSMVTWVMCNVELDLFCGDAFIRSNGSLQYMRIFGGCSLSMLADAEK